MDIILINQKAISGKLKSRTFLVIFMCFQAFVSNSQTSVWDGLIDESDVIAHVSILDIDDPNLFVTNLQLSRKVRLSIKNIIYTKGEENLKTEISIKLFDVISNKATIEDDLRIKEGVDYVVFLKLGVDEKWKLTNRYIGIVPHDPFCVMEIEQSTIGK